VDFELLVMGAMPQQPICATGFAGCCSLALFLFEGTQGDYAGKEVPFPYLSVGLK
jgi:hypothetical protein